MTILRFQKQKKYGWNKGVIVLNKLMDLKLTKRNNV
jgi:hypothetical protein